VSGGPTLQRLERVLVMVPWLLEHPGVTVDEVAERFEVAPQELVRDLDILGYCGLPGYGGGDLIEASIVGDRISVRMADYFSRPLALSMREALTLLLAGSALAAVDSLPESETLASALKKLRGALGTDAQVAIDLTSPGDEHLDLLRQAVTAQRVVRLVYRSGSKSETTERLVEPWAVVGANGAWYLHGWCRLAQEPRHFRLDRIRELELTSAGAEHEAPSKPEPAVYRPAEGDRTVVLDLRPAAAWLREWVVADEVGKGARGAQRVTFRTPQLDWIARLLLRLGTDAAVVEPPELRQRVAELAAAALARYS